MKSIEFTTNLHGGRIGVPSQFELRDGQTVRVTLLVQEAVIQASQTDALEATAGSWGGELVREPQGDYPNRLSLDK